MDKKKKVKEGDRIGSVLEQSVGVLSGKLEVCQGTTKVLEKIHEIKHIR